jgi:hypothetical protein
MRAPARSDVDIIKELRLRRWAREHYVAAEERSAKWHPVVLEEMARRDGELDFQRAEMGPGGRYVPLAPSPVRIFHQRHVSFAAPNFLSRAALEVAAYFPG